MGLGVQFRTDSVVLEERAPVFVLNLSSTICNEFVCEFEMAIGSSASLRSARCMFCLSSFAALLSDGGRMLLSKVLCYPGNLSPSKDPFIPEHVPEIRSS